MGFNISGFHADNCPTMRSRGSPSVQLIRVFLLILPVLGWAQSTAPSTLSVNNAATPDGSPLVETGTISGGVRFPSLYFTDYLISMSNQADSRPYWASAENEITDLESEEPSILLNNDIVAF